MRINSRSEKAYMATEAILGVGIFILFSGLVIAFVLNLYNMNLSMHRTAMATNYIVEILEKAKLLDYNDSQLEEGVYQGKNLLGVNLGENYNGSLKVQNYNNLEGNENKEDIIKILEVNIEYQDGNLTKNMKISTLKLYNN